ncbi:MAG: putative zinc-binding protein, partial [Sphaerochaeta sp.]
MGCACGGDCPVLISYACSGAANTGLLADQVARKLMGDKVADMSCLAAVGANVSGFVLSAKETPRNIVIDGCKLGCGAKIFTEKGLIFEHYVITDFGVVKGKTPITEEVIQTVSAEIASRL